MNKKTSLSYTLTGKTCRTKIKTYAKREKRSISRAKSLKIGFRERKRLKGDMGVLVFTIFFSANLFDSRDVEKWVEFLERIPLKARVVE